MITSTWSTGNTASSTFALTIVITTKQSIFHQKWPFPFSISLLWSSLLSLTICWAWYNIRVINLSNQRQSIHSTHFSIKHTPITILAPARAANIDKMPVPQPTSSTTLSLNKCQLLTIAFLYDFVYSSSKSTTNSKQASWIPTNFLLKNKQKKLTKMSIWIPIVVRITICFVHRRFFFFTHFWCDNVVVFVVRN